MSPKVSARHKENRRDQILEGAARCFVSRGYAETTMQDILRETGLSTGAIYSYFNSKLEIYLALAERQLEHDLHFYARAIDRETTATAKLERLIELYMASFADPARHEFTQLYLREFLPSAPGNDLLRERLQSRNQRIHALFVTVLQDGVARGEFRPVNCAAIAALIVAAGDGLRLHSVTVGTLADPAQMYQAFRANIRQALAR